MLLVTISCGEAVLRKPSFGILRRRARSVRKEATTSADCVRNLLSTQAPMCWPVASIPDYMLAQGADEVR